MVKMQPRRDRTCDGLIINAVDRRLPAVIALDQAVAFMRDPAAPFKTTLGSSDGKPLDANFRGRFHLNFLLEMSGT
jgi:hypothetical protein